MISKIKPGWYKEKIKRILEIYDMVIAATIFLIAVFFFIFILKTFIKIMI